MAHLTASVEYGVHALLWLADTDGRPRSGRDLAAFQGIPASFLLKVLAKMEKAGIVQAFEGARGGFLLAREARSITLMQIVDAIEGRKPLFECRQIRGRCALFGAEPPDWATQGVCSIHAAMLEAEKAMRDSLSARTLADIGASLSKKAPAGFSGAVDSWFAASSQDRAEKFGRSPTEGGQSHD